MSDMTEKNITPLGVRVAALRRAHGMNAYNLATASGTRVASGLETGAAADPPLSSLRKLAHALEVTLGELCGQGVEFDEARGIEIEKAQAVVDRLTEIRRVLTDLREPGPWSVKTEIRETTPGADNAG